MNTTVTKDDVSRFTRRLYKFLDNGHKIEFRRMRSIRGFIFTEEYPTLICLDPSDKVISTLIHEALHYFHPDESEEWILKMESKIVRRLSERQVKNIIRRLAKNI